MGEHDRTPQTDPASPSSTRRISGRRRAPRRHRDAEIRDAKLRDEALRAAKSAVLNVAEGAARVTRADKGRAFAIARGEAVEAFAALETAAVVGDAEAVHVERCVPVAERLYALLTGLLR